MTEYKFPDNVDDFIGHITDESGQEYTCKIVVNPNNEEGEDNQSLKRFFEFTTPLNFRLYPNAQNHSSSNDLLLKELLEKTNPNELIPYLENEKKSSEQSRILTYISNEENMEKSEDDAAKELNITTEEFMEHMEKLDNLAHSVFKDKVVKGPCILIKIGEELLLIDNHDPGMRVSLIKDGEEISVINGGKGMFGKD